jgi:hypothetical protein
MRICYRYLSMVPRERMLRLQQQQLAALKSIARTTID